MSKPVFFDHIEVHVKDIAGYCEFLKKLFCGGRYKMISDSGTSMFCSPDGMNIEVKKKKTDAVSDESGFCNPCVRMEGTKDFIENTLGFKIEKKMDNPDGGCYFFKDHEGIRWHIKDYLVRDMFINW